MPLVHMLGRDRQEAERVAAAIKATNLRDVAKDYQQDGELWVGDTHQGLCIVEFERNGYDDSDFGMVVWNPETREVDRLIFASTRGWSYPCMASRVDATPEVLAAYAEFRAAKEREAVERRNKVEARTPRKGKVVRVIGGRKAPKGTEAVIFWERIEKLGFESLDGVWYPPTGRIGLQLNDGTRVFVGANQVEVVTVTE